MKALLACLMAACGLVGCSRHTPEDSIDFVKEQETQVRGFTFGQVLESKKFCQTKQWSASLDDFGRDLVAFDCEIPLSKDVTDKLVSDSVATLEKLAKEKATECDSDPMPFVEANAPKIAAYYAGFPSVTVRPVFVIHKRQLVDSTILLLDAQGQVVKTSQKSKAMLALNFVKANNPYEPDADIRPVYEALMYSAPSFNFTCMELKEAARAAAAASPAASGAAAEPAGSANPASAPMEQDLRQTLGLVKD